MGEKVNSNSRFRKEIRLPAPSPVTSCSLYRPAVILSGIRTNGRAAVREDGAVSDANFGRGRAGIASFAGGGATGLRRAWQVIVAGARSTMCSA
ncbi:MAG: hypothetical protein BWY66_01073 [bacterium ADurb.Bin374]|nr:MAG: hypothetical protein BWY66_01073 [bacterium ADurb.Bin374]